jgi:hypothetical protein
MTDEKCEPEAIKSLKKRQENKEMDSILPGGWSENFEPDASKINQWIKDSLYKFKIYYDNNDIIKINKVYTQVVAGVNYWVSFNLGKEEYWLQVVEPVSGNIKILSLIPCFTFYDKKKSNLINNT